MLSMFVDTSGENSTSLGGLPWQITEHDLLGKLHLIGQVAKAFNLRLVVDKFEFCDGIKNK